MTSTRVVPGPEVVEDLRPRLVARGEDLAVDEFALERREERLREGVVVGVAAVPIEGMMPAAWQRWPKTVLVSWLPWSL